MIDVELELRVFKHYDTVTSTRRVWRSFNYDDFERDLSQSALVRSPPTDICELFAWYNDTLKSLLDIHAPTRRIRLSTRPSERWYDAECRETKRTTRSLERVYRRGPSDTTRAAWKHQFSVQRRLFHRKATDFWKDALGNCSDDPKTLWSTNNNMIGPPTTTHSQHSASDFATHFVNKVEKIRASTATAADLEVVSRPSTSLSSFCSVTTDEV